MAPENLIWTPKTQKLTVLANWETVDLKHWTLIWKDKTVWSQSMPWLCSWMWCDVLSWAQVGFGHPSNHVHFSFWPSLLTRHLTDHICLPSLSPNFYRTHDALPNSQATYSGDCLTRLLSHICPRQEIRNHLGQPMLSLRPTLECVWWHFLPWPQFSSAITAITSNFHTLKNIMAVIICTKAWGKDKVVLHQSCL